jgi:hypothetical protein
MEKLYYCLWNENLQYNIVLLHETSWFSGKATKPGIWAIPEFLGIMVAIQLYFIFHYAFIPVF